MAKYRIIIQNLDGGDYDGENGIECEGFFLFADNKEKNDYTQVVHEISRMDLACFIAQSDIIYPASIMARGMVESQNAEKDMKMHSVVDKMKDLFGGLSE